jgi:hypothetical protein
MIIFCWFTISFLRAIEKRYFVYLDRTLIFSNRFEIIVLACQAGILTASAKNGGTDFLACWLKGEGYFCSE